jgi:hypothetical protein
MAQEALDGLQVVAGKQEVTGKSVPEGVRRNPLWDAGPVNGDSYGSLDMGFVKVIAAHLFGFREEGEIGSGEEPLPDVLAGSVFVFLLELARQENASKTLSHILGVEAADFVHLLANFLEGTGGQWHCAVFLAFAVVDGEQHGIEVETMDTEIDAFGQAQAATVKEENDEVVGRMQVSEQFLNFAT